MEKILIIGGTAHARLYVESLLFSEYELFICGEVLSDKSNEIADEYMIHFVTFEELTSSFIRSIDLIIIATQPEKNLKIIELLLVKLNYNNTIIIEKLLGMNEDEAFQAANLLLNLEKCAIVCQRDYQLSKFSFRGSGKNKYIVSWDEPENNFLENASHVLPHLLSLLFLEFGIADVTFEIVNQTELKISHPCTQILLRFHVIPDIKGVEISGKFYHFPNYRILNAFIVETVEKQTKKETIESIQRGICVVNSMINFQKIYFQQQLLNENRIF